MKAVILTMMMVVGISVRAEWYLVTNVLSYNTIVVQLSKGTGSKNGVQMRVANLEKIEYITDNRSKVLLGGSEPKAILKDMVLGQIVWIDQFENINGENVGHLYPSYEQVVKAYMKRRMTGAYTLTPAVKQKLISVHKRMLSDLKSASPSTNAEKAAYENEYSKALFVYDGMNWFKKTGQFLPTDVQELYVDWLSDHLSATGTNAREMETKIQDMQKRSDLYRDFLFED
ncbi:hypothetical protein P4C99_08415 [Pontiellaceae bacterium B1224]|nr:hypothetical protein [Pontiellaceae bacterium B1224]